MKDLCEPSSNEILASARRLEVETFTTTAKESIQSYIDSSISRNGDGSYTARFLWKENHPPLPTNKLVCEGRTHSLVNKLVQTPKLLKVYDDILREQERRGFIEQVPVSSFTKNCHYIPHHSVRRTPLQHC